MSGPIRNLVLAACLTMLRLRLVQADTLASRSQDPAANYEEDHEDEPAAPRNVLKSAKHPAAEDAKTEERLLDENMMDHELSEHDDEHLLESHQLEEDQQMEIYNKMKSEFGEDQMEVYRKMKEQQQAQAEPPPEEEPTGPKFKTKMRMTLKGYVHEKVEDTTTTEAPPPEEPKNGTDAGAESTESAPPAESAPQKQMQADDEEESLFEGMPGQQAEWNSMIGTKNYQKVPKKEREKDWQLVNILEKNSDSHGTMYTIQRGTMQVKVKPDQLRKPIKAAEKHDGVGEDHREVDHADAPKDLDHVDVMVPLAAPVGNRCLSKPKKLGKSWEDSHSSPLECRNWCELTAHCQFVSFNEADGCNMYSKCKKTGGSGYRTWMKMRATDQEADKARQAELLEDKYMELWSMSKGLNKDKAAVPATNSVKLHDADESVEIEDVDLRVGFFSTWSTRLLGMIILGLVLGVFRMKMAAKMNMKALKDGKALDNLSVDGIVSWIQRESAAVVGILQKMMNGDKNVDSKDADDRYDVELNPRVPQEPEKKEVQLNFPKLAHKAEEPKEAAEPVATPENDAVAPEGIEGSEAEDGKASIFKASQGYHQKLYAAQPAGNLKDEANASLKSLMGGSFKN